MLNPKIDKTPQRAESQTVRTTVVMPRDIHASLITIARQERRSFGKQAIIFLEHSIKNWEKTND